MARQATTVTRSRAKKRGLASLVKEQGRTYVWLSRKTGYSVTQISRVARGEHPGSERFHIAMRNALADDYAA